MMPTANRIAALLAERAEDVAALLLPNGHREGAEWRVGSTQGEAGASLGVRLTGTQAGRWKDFASDVPGGDLLDLWQAVHHLDLREALAEARAYLGLHPIEPWAARHRATFTRPDPDHHRQPLTPTHAAWLRDVRKLPDATVAAYRISSGSDPYGRPALVFPSWRDGVLASVKYRTLDKQFSRTKGSEPCLFGWDQLPANARAVTVVEGELDCLAWHAYGVAALSIPLGANVAMNDDEAGERASWITVDFDRLAAFDTIYLNMDMDAKGQSIVETVCRRLGAERCRVVTLPYKDANECLMRGVPLDVMTRALAEARSFDPRELLSMRDLMDRVLALSATDDQGIELPWGKTCGSLRLRQGEISLWAGYNGHGKTALINHVVGHAVASGWLACVASLEYQPERWVQRFVHMMSGTGAPTEAYRCQIMAALDPWCWVLDSNLPLSARRIVEVFRYARQRYGIDLFLVDNLSKVGIADDDYARQKAFVEKLAEMARTLDCHIALVMHMRKGDTEDRPGGKMDFKGSGGIVDMADTAIEIWRNKPMERRRQNPDDQEAQRAPTTLMRVVKQRFNGEEPTFLLWFDKATTQFLGDPHHHARPLLRLDDGPGTERCP